MENMQDEDTDEEDEPDFDVDRDLHCIGYKYCL